MKLLLYTHALTGGGAERVWTTLAGALAARGHAVTLAYDFGGDAPGLAPGAHRLALGNRHAAAVARLAAHLSRERPDVSVSALGVSNLKHALAALAVGRGGRAILSFHGHPASEPGTLSRLGNALAPVLTRLTARSVFVSEGLRAHYARRGAARSVTIHNPVDTADARPARSADELVARGPLVLAVGRLAPAKDYPTLLDAFARVRPDARLVIAGEGGERGAIEAQAARLDLGSRVTLAGHVEDTGALYRAASCLALSSRAEAFGNVVVEALAHGLPVVATASDGPREILDEGRFGTLVPVGDAGTLAVALDRALAEPGDPAPRVVRAAAFSVEAAVQRYETLFREVAGERG